MQLSTAGCTDGSANMKIGCTDEGFNDRRSVAERLWANEDTVVEE